MIEHSVFVVSAKQPWKAVKQYTGEIKGNFFIPHNKSSQSRFQIGQTAFFSKQVAENRRIGRLAQILIQPRPKILVCLRRTELIDSCLRETKNHKVYKNQLRNWKELHK